MRNTLLLLTLLLSSFCFSQNDKSRAIRLDTIVARKTAAYLPNFGANIPVNMGVAKEVEASEIRITEIPSDAEFRKLTVTTAGKAVTGNFNLADRTAIYSLKSILGASNGVFEISYAGESKGKLVFTMKQETKGGGGGADSDDEAATDFVGIVGAANFIGNNKFLSNVTPMVTLGKIVEIVPGDFFSYNIDVNPYLGSQIDTDDSSSFIPALMLPGRAGILVNNYMSLNWDKLKVTLMPLGFGLKVIPGIKDSNSVIWQHNLRTGIAFSLLDVLQIGGQYTFGWHNLTSESERFYKENVNGVTRKIRYLTISAQVYVKKDDDKRNYIFIESRRLLKKDRYPGYDNTAIITLGYHSNLSLTHIFPASSKRGTEAVSTGNAKKKRYNVTVF